MNEFRLTKANFVKIFIAGSILTIAFTIFIFSDFESSLTSNDQINSILPYIKLVAGLYVYHFAVKYGCDLIGLPVIGGEITWVWLTRILHIFAAFMVLVSVVVFFSEPIVFS